MVRTAQHSVPRSLRGRAGSGLDTKLQYSLTNDLQLTKALGNSHVTHQSGMAFIEDVTLTEN